MSYLNIKNKLMFIHLIKTGGTSVQKVLETYAQNDLTVFGKTNVLHEKLVRGVMKKMPFQTKKHSLTKLRSVYAHRGGHIPIKLYFDVISKNINKKIDIEQYHIFTTVRDPWDVMVSLFFHQKKKFKPGTFPTFDEFVKHRCKDPRIEDQFEFLCDNSGKLYVKNILRFENLKDDWKEFSSKIDGLPDTLPYENVRGGEKISYREMYSKYSKELVERKYRRDIEAFGYTFDKP